MPDTTGSNGYDPAELQRYLEAVEREHDELDSLKSQHMLNCKGPRGRIKETIEAVREADINVVAFRVALKQRLAERKHEKRVAELEDDDADAYERIEQALGAFADTPLGEATLKRARPKRQKKSEALDSLKQ